MADKKIDITHNYGDRAVVLTFEDESDMTAVLYALQKPDVMAFLKIVGVLDPLPARARQRIVNYVVDKITDPESTLNKPEF